MLNIKTTNKTKSISLPTVIAGQSVTKCEHCLKAALHVFTCLLLHKDLNFHFSDNSFKVLVYF